MILFLYEFFIDDRSLFHFDVLWLVD